MDSEISPYLHIGCGHFHLNGWLNTDVDENPNADLVLDVTDLSRFSDKSFSIVYGNAIWEHLYISQCLPTLIGLSRVLRDDGTVIMTGIPNIDEVIKMYQNKVPWKEGNQWGADFFCINNLKQHIFGMNPNICTSPENWSQGMIHKNLWSPDEVKSLLDSSPFVKTYKVFTYCWGNEAYPTAIGFIAGNLSTEYILPQLPAYINMATLKFA